MRSVRFSGGGGCLPQCMLGYTHPPPPHSGQNDRHLRKYYLAVTTLQTVTRMRPFPHSVNVLHRVLTLMFQMETLDTVKRIVVDDRPGSFEDCVSWARNLFQDNYNNTIRQLLFNFPPDQVTIHSFLRKPKILQQGSNM